MSGKSCASRMPSGMASWWPLPPFISPPCCPFWVRQPEPEEKPALAEAPGLKPPLLSCALRPGQRSAPRRSCSSAGRSARAVREDMAEMRIAIGAANLGARHAIGAVDMLRHRILADRRREARPACAGVELGAGIIERIATADAVVDARLPSSKSGLENARSVPCWRVMRYCSGVSCARHSASLLTTFSGEAPVSNDCPLIATSSSRLKALGATLGSLLI